MSDDKLIRIARLRARVDEAREAHEREERAASRWRLTARRMAAEARRYRRLAATLAARGAELEGALSAVTDQLCDLTSGGDHLLCVRDAEALLYPWLQAPAPTPGEGETLEALAEAVASIPGDAGDELRVLAEGAVEERASETRLLDSACGAAAAERRRADILAVQVTNLDAVVRDWIAATEHTARVPPPDPTYALLVASLGGVGYGALMSEASRQWRLALAQDGCAGGEYAVGPARMVIADLVRRSRAAITPTPAPGEGDSNG